jgi:hypothetical protein
MENPRVAGQNISVYRNKLEAGSNNNNYYNKKFCGFSSPTDYTDRAAAACQRS